MRRWALGIGEGWRTYIPGPRPGAPLIPPGTPPAATQAAIFPTNVKVGDVVQVTGPFGAVEQGRVVVRFAGAEPQAIFLNGPWGGSAVVPDDAVTGACEVELDGRVIFGTTCNVIRERASAAPEHRGKEHWSSMRRTTLMGLEARSYIPLSRQRRHNVSGMPTARRRRGGYVDDGFEASRGVGAVAALDMSPVAASRSLATAVGPMPLYPGVSVKATAPTVNGRAVYPDTTVVQGSPLPASPVRTASGQVLAMPTESATPTPVPPWATTVSTVGPKRTPTTAVPPPAPTPDPTLEPEPVFAPEPGPTGMSTTTKWILGGVAAVALYKLLKG